MEYKTLNIKGAILSQNQLENYLEKIASDHNLTNYSDKSTYPIPRLKENLELITEVYQLLNEHIKLKIPIHPAGEWILDNYYVIDETAKSIKNTLTLKKYKNFLGIANGTYQGFARVYVLASEIVNYSDNQIDGKNLSQLLQAYQKKKTLNMEEIWNIPLFLQIALIENIREICEKIYSVQMQKYKVENIIERLVEYKNKEELQFNHLGEYKAKVKGSGEMKYPFIEYLSYRLRKYGKKAYPYLAILEEQVNKMGMTLDEVIQKEHFDIALRKISVGNCITSLKNLNRISMVEIFEEINGVEDILKQDPANVYEKMDYETKVLYRNKIKELSQKTRISEIYIAKEILNLAREQANKEQENQINNNQTNSLEENKKDDKQKQVNNEIPIVEQNKRLISDKKKEHVGYYLLSDGKAKLWERLTGKKKEIMSNTQKIGISILLCVIATIFIDILFGIYIYHATKSVVLSVILAILLLIPTQTLLVQIAQSLLGKMVKPKPIPKLDFQKGVPKEFATFIVVPTIINSREKVHKIMEQLETYYIANQSDNLYFALLGDCTSGKNEVEPWDEEVIQAGLEETQKLNQQYPCDKFPRFHFLYRQRTWNAKEECYLGWERKRGLLNQFNEYILNKSKNNFLANTIEIQREGKHIPLIKYIITLDADTNLTLNTGLEMIGAMAHILNLPVLNQNNDLVTSGHALIQPRVGISLQDVQKSLFTQAYAGSGGKDAYTNAISDVYQDNFEEGIFTGKGIYDVGVFSKVLNNEIPENTVLSHDLLEGCYLRCGLASDIMLMDGYPSGYNSFKARLHRWIRGDWQIIPWLKGTIINKANEKKHNPLTLLSKYKIFDNLIRSMQETSIVITLIIISIINLFYEIKITPIVIFLFISLLIPTILEVIDRIVSKKEQETVQKTFTKTLSGVKASLLRGFLAIANLPDKAYFCFQAAIKTLYRICFSKKHFLEWMTAEEAEKNAKKDVLSYYKNMGVNIVLGILAIALLFLLPKDISTIFIFILAVIWLIAPSIFCYMSKERKEIEKIQQLSAKEQEYLLEIGAKTWQYFKENMNEKSNFLPPDNYQEDRKPKVMNRTSPTNIGLGLLAVVSSYDLGYENLEDTIHLLEKMINTIQSLPKWNGHLYNWYDLESLQPLMPRYISSVDSGNLVGYLYTVKQFLKEQQETQESNSEKEIGVLKDNAIIELIQNLIEMIDKLIRETDFSKLYDETNRLFSIGFNVEENKLTDSYYDLLASEARQTSLIAIAQKQVPIKHWNNLSRTLTILNKYKGLISWSGTAFEYLMPNINIPKYPGSLLDESCKFMLMSQKEYAKKLNIPWGISESAFYLKDLHNNYQYKAFGIPWLGLKRGLADEMVVAPYASILALPDEPKEVVKNLKILQQQGMYQKYGFYESIDYTPTRLKKGEEYALVKTYMAHHQGLILLSINNLFHNKILTKRFMKNPQIRAVDILLQEKMPENVIITKEEKEKVEKMKYVDDQNYWQKEITKPMTRLPQMNVLSSNHYQILMDAKGNGYSQFEDILINRYKKTEDLEQGIFFFLKNVKTKRIWTANCMNYLSQGDKYAIYFMPDQNKIVRQDGSIETVMNVTIAPNEPVELRTIELTNYGLEEETIEVTSYLEPVLSTMSQDYSHPAFNNLFLSYEYLEEQNAILVHRRNRNEKEIPIYLGAMLYTENKTTGDLEYEIDKEKFYGRNGFQIPRVVENSIPLSKQIQYTTDPIISFKRTITIQPEETVKLNLIIAVGHDKGQVQENLKYFSNQETIKHSFELEKAKIEAENRYLGVKGKQLEFYQKMLGYLLLQNPLKKLQYTQTMDLPVAKLWEYGISGDLPILLCKVKTTEDIEILNQLLKFYYYFHIKNILFDFVIIDEEKYSYNSNVKEEITSSIVNENLSYLQNSKGGIFVLENLEKQEKEFLEYRANLSIPANCGSLYRYIKELEEEFRYHVKEMPSEEPYHAIEETKPIREPLENLKYDNEYGGFLQDGKEYHIRMNKEQTLPTIWSHLLVNENFGTLVTETMGGYTWHKNSRLNRLTAWHNSQVTDEPSEVIFMQDLENKKVWSLGFNPCPDENDYHITYGFGYAKYQHSSKEFSEEVEMFVPMEQPVKVQILKINNNELKKKKVKLVYYLKPVLGEDEIKSNGYCDLEFLENTNTICMKNLVADSHFARYMFVSCSEQITSYTGSKAAFLGKGTIANPEALHQIELNKENALWEDGVIAIQCEVELEALENKKIVLILGVGQTKLDCQDLAYQYQHLGKVYEEYEKTKRFWREKTEKLKVETPLESMNLLLNGWLIYQVLASRLWGRTGYYQSGGAYGFRDQLQDTLALKYIDTQLMKKQIIKHSSHQFVEGDVEHWWHDETGRGIRTRFSDDRLWLVYLVEDYISFTGDDSILEEQVPYRAGNQLEEGIDEKYDAYPVSNIVESIYEHCKKAITISLNFGEHGIPKIGAGDWNDGFSEVGNKGKGESVWLGFFLYEVLKKFIPICKQKGEETIAKQYEEVMEKLKKALNTSAWDGRWYKRAFMDDGHVLGSIQNEECRIDSIAQSWSVISGAGDNDKKYISMESLENHLVDKENGIIKLLDPPFEKGVLNPGYIKAYLPGTRENGGQYTHSSIWAIIAETILGFGNKAGEYYRMINPIEHSRTKESAKKYKVEPYVIAADVYGQKNLAGRGGWTWYTGSASWMYEAGIKYILGLKIEKNKLKIEPCIPNDWKEYSIKYQYGNSIYHIHVQNQNGKETGVTCFLLDGQEIEEKEIQMNTNGGIYNIEVEM